MIKGIEHVSVTSTIKKKRRNYLGDAFADEFGFSSCHKLVHLQSPCGSFICKSCRIVFTRQLCLDTGHYPTNTCICTDTRYICTCKCTCIDDGLYCFTWLFHQSATVDTHM